MGTNDFNHQASITFGISRDDHKRHWMELFYKKESKWRRKTVPYKTASRRREASGGRPQTLLNLEGVDPMRCHRALFKGSIESKHISNTFS